MTDRCKIGDIAVIIKDEVGCEANIGRFVHVEGPRKSCRRRGAIWRIRPVIGTTITYMDTDKSIVIGPAEQIEHEDDWLMPVRPEDLDALDQSIEAPRPVSTEIPSLEIPQTT